MVRLQVVVAHVMLGSCEVEEAADPVHLRIPRMSLTNLIPSRGTPEKLGEFALFDEVTRQYVHKGCHLEDFRKVRHLSEGFVVEGAMVRLTA